MLIPRSCSLCSALLCVRVCGPCFSHGRVFVGDCVTHWTSQRFVRGVLHDTYYFPSSGAYGTTCRARGALPLLFSRIPGVFNALSIRSEASTCHGYNHDSTFVCVCEFAFYCPSLYFFLYRVSSICPLPFFFCCREEGNGFFLACASYWSRQIHHPPIGVLELVPLQTAPPRSIMTAHTHTASTYSITTVHAHTTTATYNEYCFASSITLTTHTTTAATNCRYH